MASSKSKRKSATPDTGPATHCQFERWKPSTVSRRELKNAPYNPRVISDRAKDLLKKNLGTVGLLEPIIWNRKTGNIVGGHQRLAALDALEGKENYTLTVSEVELDDATEREQNIFLNNPNAQGDWDIEALEEMLKEGTNLENAGFSRAEVMQLFGDDALTHAPNEMVETLAEQVRETHERYWQLAEAAGKDRDTDDFFIVCKDVEQRGRLCELLGVENNRYVDGAAIVKALEEAQNERDTSGK